MKASILIFSILFITTNLSAQNDDWLNNGKQINKLIAPSIEWSKCYGGSADDNLWTIDLTPDGGYILGGSTNSKNGDITTNHGKNDCWVVKINSKGDIEWQKSYGGSSNDGIFSIISTSDGGYIAACYSDSKDGDVSKNNGNLDYWIVKLTSSGEIEWQKSMGGSNLEIPNSIIQTLDNGYVIAGYTNSEDGDISGNHGEEDYWIVKLTPSGEIEWQKCLGYFDFEVATAIIQTSTGEYVVAGFHNDASIFKLDNNGNEILHRTYGGGYPDVVSSFQQTTDGGYIIGGMTLSSDLIVTENHGEEDFWILKLRPDMEIEWQKCLGGSYRDYGTWIQLTNDGGYIFCGFTESDDFDVYGNNGSIDIWITKLDNEGIIEWQKCLGGTSDDLGAAIHQINDGGFILGGSTNSIDGEVFENHGLDDFWVVKLSPEGDDGIKTLPSTQIGLHLYPNPVEDKLSIEFNLDEPENVQIVVYSLLGEEMLSVNYGLQSEGGHLYQINTDKFPQSMYKLILRAGENQFPTKFIKV
ncbi:MAG: hypothetical protein A2X64_01730 [Ignavibacteria bacterium GWF2_33_9]|nr:MAG: hypothetical protein A2X64_01730 [Ignavibacteria bacterium GWF2_33_9]